MSSSTTPSGCVVSSSTTPSGRVVSSSTTPSGRVVSSSTASSPSSSPIGGAARAAVGYSSASRTRTTIVGEAYRTVAVAAACTAASAPAAPPLAETDAAIAEKQTAATATAAAAAYDGRRDETRPFARAVFGSSPSSSTVFFGDGVSSTATTRRSFLSAGVFGSAFVSALAFASTGSFVFRRRSASSSRSRWPSRLDKSFTSASFFASALWAFSALAVSFTSPSSASRRRRLHASPISICLASSASSADFARAASAASPRARASASSIAANSSSVSS